jgi:oxygen-independent coproporphyrinogen-3 oxidase
MSGIYIHIPFCRKKCSYCDFHFSTSFSSYRNDMVQSIVDELKGRLAEFENSSLNTIYFGGGTPSLLEKNELDLFFDVISKFYAISSIQEITLEANPEDINEKNLNSWKELGINRLSIGIQSFKETDLTWMNRAHSVNESRLAVEKAFKNGFSNLTIDLMYGLPDLSLLEWENHIDEVLSWNINHISAYCLTIEKGTLLEKKIEKGQIPVPDEENAIQQFELLIEKLERAGFVQYEISNFARGDHRAIHNSSYWKGEKYIGIGPSAHSFDGIKRRWNIANNSLYMKRKSWFEEEILGENERWNEYFLTGLRTMEGISIKELSKKFDLNSFYFETKEKFLKQGWLSEQDEQLKLTKQGKLRADYIASEFFRV